LRLLLITSVGLCLAGGAIGALIVEQRASAAVASEEMHLISRTGDAGFLSRRISEYR
jgi:hypothetical protein